MLPSIVGVIQGAGAPPVAPNSYESIATVTVGSTPTATISFGSIPNTYKSLELRWIARTDRTNNSDVILINPNGLATTTGHFIYGTGSSAISGVGNGYIGWATGGTSAANNFCVGVLTIIDYTDTNKNKVTKSLSGWDGNASGAGEIAFFSDLQTSTTSLSNFTITSSTGANFQQYTQFALYGVK